MFTMRRGDLLVAVNFGDEPAELVVDGDLDVSSSVRRAARRSPTGDSHLPRARRGPARLRAVTDRGGVDAAHALDRPVRSQRRPLMLRRDRRGLAVRSRADGRSRSRPSRSPGTQFPVDRARESPLSVANACRSPRGPSQRRPGRSARPPPSWLGKRVLPRAGRRLRRGTPTPPELDQRRFTLPDQLPPLPGHRLRLAGDHSGAGRRDRPVDLEAGLPGRRDRPVLGPADLLGVRRPSAHRRAAGQPRRWPTTWSRCSARSTPRGSRSRRCGSPALDELDAPPTGDGNNTGAFACRPTTGASSYSQHAYGLADRREPVPEPLRQGRRGAAGAGVVVPRPRLGAPRDDRAATARSCARSPRSAGRGVAPGSR